MTNVRNLVGPKADAAVTATNLLRYDLFHILDGYGVHADASLPVAVADAVVDGYATSSCALLNACATAYTAHLASVASPVTGLGAHRVADSTNVITASIATSLATGITLSNDYKSKFNAHIANSTVHLTGNSVDAVTLSNDGSELALVALANQIKAKTNSHFSKAFASQSISVVLP